MGVNSSKKAIEKSIAVYEKMLEDLPEDAFIKTPAEGVWSYAEVYSHIFSSNIGCCKAISVCAAGTGIEDSKPLKFPLRLVMYFKRLPPGKYKVPERIAKDVIKLSKEDASGLWRRSSCDFFGYHGPRGLLRERRQSGPSAKGHLGA